MAKKGEARQRLTLKCTDCGRETYRTEKNKRNTTEKLELNKYCRFCKKTTVHKEAK